MSTPSSLQMALSKNSRVSSGGHDGNPVLQREHPTLNTDRNGQGPFGLTFSQPRQNRYSTQTEALTIDTDSPFASPTASTFRPDGLAPRPPSFGHVGGEYSKEFVERRQKRKSQNRSQSHDENPPPAAPDVPRAAPPISYKLPYAEIASSGHQTVPRTRSTRRPEGPVSPSDAHGDYYRPETAELGRSNSRDYKGKGVEGRDDRSQSYSRKGSVAESEAQRRREWAPDKSPLQSLERTLDSITKEEKRARVEEAELLAREAKAGRGGDRAIQSSVRFRNRPVGKGPEAKPQPEPQTLSDAGLVRSLSNKQKDQLQRSGTMERRRPAPADMSTPGDASRGFDYQLQTGDTRQKSRPTDRERSTIPATIGAVGAIGTARLATASLSRNGSNKLRNYPPEDPSLMRRQSSQSHYQEDAELRRPSVGGQRSGTEAGSRGVSLSDPPRPSMDKDLRHLPQGMKPTSPRLDEDPDKEVDVNAIRQNNARKFEQLMGEKPPLDSQQMNSSNTVGVGRSATLRNPGAPRLISLDATKSASSQPIATANTISSEVYVASNRLDEWKRGGAVLLDGALLNLEASEGTENDKTWWEAGGASMRRGGSTKQRRAEAYDGEYDGSNAPTRFKPPLFLRSGPLLRYCGLRRERRIGHFAPGVPRPEREIWRGSVMIVTEDSKSSYELAPTLRLFVQPVDLLPPPPARLDGVVGELAPEYIDPIAGLPKLGRDGRTLYIRPVDHLEEMQDLSRDESEEGIFESRKSLFDGGIDPKKPIPRNGQHDGEKAGKYKEIRGFRLHAERGVTFWKFNIEIELRAKQQRIAYRINRGPATGFWVPARDQAMNIMFHSCNGFSLGVDTNQFSGPDPMWRDVLNTHQTQPFHVMLGGGDQIYNDAVQEQTVLFKQWTEIRDYHHKERMPFTPELQDELEQFYLDRYSVWFSLGLFGLAASQIPMINIFDDHDIIDGWGSYADSYMKSPIMSGLGAVAFKYYMLFQHQTSIDEGEETEPSWILGAQPGPYIPELSRSIFTHLGRSIAFLGLDCRTERMHDEVVSPETYDKVLDRLEKNIVKGETKHLIVLLGVPMAYPRMVWLENILTSRLMDPVKAMSRAGLLGKGFLNRLDGGVEILDDLDDHWTARHHKDERHFFISELQDLAAAKSVRITILGGDVHLAAIGQFYSNPKLKIPRDRDHRYMPNIISSAIVNTPPPDTVADLLNRRNKVHHFDAYTDEDMMPKFIHDVNGKAKNNKRLLNRRNWCSIRAYDPEVPTPTSSSGASFERAPSPPQNRGNLFRRLSGTRRSRNSPDAINTDGSRPPLSSTSFFSQRQASVRRPSTDSQSPGGLTRTLSLTRKDFTSRSLFHRNSKKKPDSGGINGYGAESDDDVEYNQQSNPSGIRGGSIEDNQRGHYPPVSKQLGHTNSYTVEISSASNSQTHIQNPKGKLTRTLTSQTVRQGVAEDGINREGALEISLNVEVNSKDPAGITTPYCLLVPRLWYEEEEDLDEVPQNTQTGLKRWVSFSKKKNPRTAANELNAPPSAEGV